MMVTSTLSGAPAASLPVSHSEAQARAADSVGHGDLTAAGAAATVTSNGSRASHGEPELSLKLPGRSLAGCRPGPLLRISGAAESVRLRLPGKVH